jgi:hypothetical protein
MFHTGKIFEQYFLNIDCVELESGYFRNLFIRKLQLFYIVTEQHSQTILMVAKGQVFFSSYTNHVSINKIT